jgi:aminoglycoside phosphotransferase (APT) family kinase protein
MIEVVKEILQVEHIEYRELEKSESGFSNVVYFIDDRYVIKVLEPDGNEIKFTNEIGFYNSVSFDFIPRCISSGMYKDTKYIIIEKLQGVSLYEVWHKLSKEERERITIQIAHILKDINNTRKFDFLNPKYIRDDLVNLYQNAFDKNIAILTNKGYDTSFLKNFSEKRVPIIFEESKCGLVYNDAHFDNFIYDGHRVKLIDFDRVLYTSIDYELLILEAMVRNPKKFANERMEAHVVIKDYQEILPIFKKVYPELFDFKYLEERLYIYSFFYTLGNIYTFDLDHLLAKVLDDFLAFFSKQSK